LRSWDDFPAWQVSYVSLIGRHIHSDTPRWTVETHEQRALMARDWKRVGAHMIQVRLGRDDDTSSRPIAQRVLWRLTTALTRLALAAISAGTLRSLRLSRASDSERIPDALPRQGEFERWFAQYQPPLLDYLYGMTRDREWAADLAQETFLRAYTSITRDPVVIEHPQAWLYRIATNVALSALRRKRRFDWLPLSVVEPKPGADSLGHMRIEAPELRGQDIAATVVERDAVWTVLADLPPRWRAALLLQAVGGFETKEIAAELGVSEVNARKILFRAKERFRQIIARREADEARGDAV
jgi:RNA polymerase sigma factor (sigma-70 family)